MKKLSLLILLFCFSLNKGFAQNAFYDALYCASLVEEDTDVNDETYSSSLTNGDKKVLKDFKEFLKTPFKNQPPDMARVKAIYQKINAAQSSNIVAQGFVGGAAVAGLVAPIFNLSKLSSGKVDTLLYGLTIYFADEFRKAYMQTYLNGFNKTIGKTGELKVLFPNTYNKLSTFDPFRYKELGNELKTVFDQDLASSLDHLKEHINDGDAQKQCNILTTTVCDKIKKSNFYPYLNLSAEIGQELIKGVHPSNILEHLANSSTITGEIKENIHLFNVLQRNLRDSASAKNGQFTNAWISFDKLAQLKNSKSKAYFMAFLYHENNGIIKKITSFDPNNSENIAAFDELMKDKISKLLPILTQIDDYTRLKDKTILEEQNFVPLFNLMTAFVKIAVPANDLNQVNKIAKLSNDVFMVYNAIRVKNYGNIPTYINGILLSVGTEAFLGIKEKEEFQTLIKKYDYLTGFMASTVNAKSSEEVKDVIKKYANPPTTFIEKRESAFRMTLGGMPGLTVNYEFMKDTLGQTQKGVNVGLSLPVGIDFTLGKIFKNYSIGAFAQLIDLGAMLNYRLGSGSNTLPDKVGFKNVLSPGISFAMGFPNTPFTILLGHHWGPVLRDIEKDKLTLKTESSNSWHIRFTYDIPLFKLVGSRSY